MGRFHRHDGEDGHHHHHEHDHEHEHHDHEHLGDHSGYETGGDRIEILERIFDENDHAAEHNREALDAADVISVNLMSSPGAGKTAILERTLAALEGKKRIGIVEGDIETALDADRLGGFGAQISLLNTGDGFGGECHLDAPMVARALQKLDLNTLDLLLIENVGNLVCPAEFDVGAHARAMVTSVTEGEDKPLKYPVMFRNVDVILVNKVDLLPYLAFDMALFEKNIRAVNADAKIIHTSATTGQGLEEWTAWLTNLENKGGTPER